MLLHQLLTFKKAITEPLQYLLKMRYVVKIIKIRSF